jgi:hypothetical protein
MCIAKVETTSIFATFIVVFFEKKCFKIRVFWTERGELNAVDFFYKIIAKSIFLILNDFDMEDLIENALI